LPPDSAWYPSKSYPPTTAHAPAEAITAGTATTSGAMRNAQALGIGCIGTMKSGTRKGLQMSRPCRRIAA
jgi:hypothetical protein